MSPVWAGIFVSFAVWSTELGSFIGLICSFVFARNSSTFSSVMHRKLTPLAPRWRFGFYLPQLHLLCEFRAILNHLVKALLRNQMPIRDDDGLAGETANVGVSIHQVKPIGTDVLAQDHRAKSPGHHPNENHIVMLQLRNLLRQE